MCNSVEFLKFFNSHFFKTEFPHLQVNVNAVKSLKHSKVLTQNTCVHKMQSSRRFDKCCAHNIEYI